MQTWYNLKAAADKTPVLSIFDDIGAYGVSAKSFLNDLRTVTTDEVDVEINSPGGDVFAGLAIYNGLRASGKKINVKVLRLAALPAWPYHLTCLLLPIARRPLWISLFAHTSPPAAAIAPPSCSVALR